MVNVDKLREKIKESGMSIVAITEKAGMNRETFYNRMNGKGEFKASEIVMLSEVLRMSCNERDSIFFARKSELNSLVKDEGVELCRK